MTPQEEIILNDCEVLRNMGGYWPVAVQLNKQNKPKPVVNNDKLKTNRKPLKRKLKVS